MKPYERFLEYCEKNPQWKTQTVEQVAAKVGVSSANLRWHIRHNTGLNYSQYRGGQARRAKPNASVMDRRAKDLRAFVEEARRVGKHLTIGMIAKHFGISQSTASRDYERAFGVSIVNDNFSRMQPRTDATLHQRNRSAVVRGKRLAMGGRTKKQLAAMHAAGQISDAEWKGVEMVYNGEY